MRINKKIVVALSRPLALISRPYAAIARRLGMTESQLLGKIREYKSGGIIRRVGIVLGHFQAGYRCNALVLWQVDEVRLAETGTLCAGFPQVTHCYARQTYPGWPYNLYTMVHAKSKKELLAVVLRMSAETKVTKYKIQLTVKEFKKIKSNLKEILA